MAVQGAVRGMATELQASVLDSAARRAMAAMVFRVVMAADTPEAMALRDMVVIREDMAIRNTQTAVSPGDYDRGAPQTSSAPSPRSAPPATMTMPVYGTSPGDDASEQAEL